MNLSNTPPPMIIFTGNESIHENICIVSKLQDSVKIQYQFSAIVPDLVILDNLVERHTNLFDGIIKTWRKKEIIDYLFTHSIHEPYIDAHRHEDNATVVYNSITNHKYTDPGTYTVNIIFELSEADYLYYTLKFK